MRHVEDQALLYFLLGHHASWLSNGIEANVTAVYFAILVSRLTDLLSKSVADFC